MGVPGLMDLPVAEAVFRTTFKDRYRNELLVLIRRFAWLAPGETEPVLQDLMQHLTSSRAQVV